MCVWTDTGRKYCETDLMVRRDWVIHCCHNGKMKKVDYNTHRGSDDGWDAKLYYLNRFWYQNM